MTYVEKHHNLSQAESDYWKARSEHLKATDQTKKSILHRKLLWKTKYKEYQEAKYAGSAPQGREEQVAVVRLRYAAIRLQAEYDEEIAVANLLENSKSSTLPLHGQPKPTDFHNTPGGTNSRPSSPNSSTGSSSRSPPAKSGTDRTEKPHSRSTQSESEKKRKRGPEDNGETTRIKPITVLKLKDLTETGTKIKHLTIGDYIEKTKTGPWREYNGDGTPRTRSKLLTSLRNWHSSSGKDYNNINLVVKFPNTSDWISWNEARDHVQNLQGTKRKRV